MIKSCFVLLAYLSISSSFASVKECSKSEMLLKQELSVSTGLEQLLSQPYDVISVSDNHNDPYWTNEKSPYLLSEILQESKPDCLFLEQPSDLQQPLYQYENGEIQWSEYINIVKTKYESTLDEYGLRDSFDSEDDKALIDFFSFKESLVRLALKNKMKLFAVDEELRFQIQEIASSGNYTMSSIVKRNKIVSQNISKLYLAGECKEGVLFIGDAHLIFREVDSEDVTVQAILKKSGLRTKTILATSADNIDDTPYANINSECLRKLKREEENSILLSNPQSPLIDYFPRSWVEENGKEIELKPIDDSIVDAWFFFK